MTVSYRPDTVTDEPTPSRRPAMLNDPFFQSQPYPLWCGVAIDRRESPDQDAAMTVKVGRVIGWAVGDADDEDRHAVVPLVAFDDDETGATESAVGVVSAADVAMFVRDTQKEALAAAKSYVEHGKVVKRRPSAIVH